MKTVFVTLLMIGIAMGQGGTGYVTSWDECDPRPLSHKGDHILCAFDGTKWRLIVEPPLVPKPAKPPANKAAPITELMSARKCKIVPAGDGCNACTVCDGPNSASTCTTLYCAQKGEIEKLLKSQPEETRSMLPGDGGGMGDLLEWKPLDVPAIRKTRVIHPKGTCWGEGQNAVCAMQKDDTEDYWDCKDPDAYSLQVSVSGKNARCHRIAP